MIAIIFLSSPIFSRLILNQIHHLNPEDLCSHSGVCCREFCIGSCFLDAGRQWMGIQESEPGIPWGSAGQSLAGCLLVISTLHPCMVPKRSSAIILTSDSHPRLGLTSPLLCPLCPFHFFPNLQTMEVGISSPRSPWNTVILSTSGANMYTQGHFSLANFN